MDTKKLRQKILDLAIRGKLVPQDPNDEPASILLERIRAEKERLIAEGKIKRPKKSKTTSSESHYQNLPEGWVSTNLNDIAWFGGGKTPATDNDLFWENGSINWITSKDMKEPIIYKSKIQLSLLGASQNTLYPAGTLVMVTRSGILRRTLPLAILGHESTVNQDIKAICTPYYEITEYLYWYFTALETDILEQYQKDGTTVESIDFEKFQEIEIILPPFNELKRIIGQLISLLHLIDLITTNSDEIVETIEKTKSKILELAMEGKLVPQDPADESAAEMLRRINPNAKIITDNPHSWNIPNGWCLCELRDLCTFLSRGKSPKYSDVPNQYPVFAQKCNLKDGGISLNQARFLDESTLPKWPNKYKLKDQDILVNSTGTGTVGRTRLFLNKYLKDFPFVLPDSHVSVVRTFDEIDSKFIYYNLISREGQTYFNDNLSGSTNQKELYIETIGNKLIFLPPKKEQEWIVARIEELYHCIDKIEASLQS